MSGAKKFTETISRLRMAGQELLRLPDSLAGIDLGPGLHSRFRRTPHLRG